jgi:hypothetical protein
MAEPKKDFLTVDDLQLLMQGYKNTVELSSNVLKQQQDIITCIKEINEDLVGLKDIIYDTAGKTQEKIDNQTLRGIDKVEIVSNKLELITTGFKKDITEQNEKMGSNKEEIVNKLSKLQLLTFTGIIGLVGIIGSLLSYMYMFAHDHKELLGILKAIAQKLGVVIQ